MKLHQASADSPALLERRQQLVNAVDRAAIVIAAGEWMPALVELEQLAQLCEDFFLPREAARVRRWMTS